jgi:hypothetical protein
MRRPRCKAAIVPRPKVEDDLLNLDHPIGGGKAKFFIHFGFQRNRWEELASALFGHAQENPVTNTRTDADGIACVIEGRLATPSGRKPRVRTVWLVETGGLAPPFITACPLQV